jgi:hypothetical protein
VRDVVHSRQFGWLWSHDIRPDQVGCLAAPGRRLIRLSSYGSGSARRFAALLYDGDESAYRLDLDSTALGTCAGASAVTADDEGRFSVVLGDAPSTVYADLDEEAAHALTAGGRRITDLATYLVDGARRYAVVLDTRTGPGWLLTNLTGRQLNGRLRRLHAVPVRLRAHPGDAEPRFSAVAEPDDGGSWFWYADLDADRVAHRLEAKRAYPVDLDAIRRAVGVRFTVVMRR